MSRRSSDAVSEQSKVMVLANSVLEGRRLFHDFDRNNDGKLEPIEVHSALCDLGLTISREESERLLAYLDMDSNGTVSEEEFTTVVSYRVRSAVVRSKNRDQLSSILPKKVRCLFHHCPITCKPGICSWYLCSSRCLFVPLRGGLCRELQRYPRTLSGLFTIVLSIYYSLSCLIHFTLMHPKHDSMMDTGLQWNVTWERDRKRIAMSYLRGWFFVDFVSCIPFDIIAAEADDDGLYTNLRLLRIVRILRIAKLLKILDGGRQFKRFERWLSLRHTVAETVGVVVTMVFCAHWTACLWMPSFPRKRCGWR